MKKLFSIFFTLMCILSSIDAAIDSDFCEGVEDEQEKFENPDDCAGFYVCMDGEPKEGFCPSDSFFDPISKECDLEECPNSTEEPTEEPTEDPSTEIPSSTSNPEIEDGISCPTDLPPNTPSFIPSEEYCERYYLCINGIPNVMYCRKGLHFNTETLQCDFPVDANCEVSFQIFKKILTIILLNNNFMTQLSRPEGLPQCSNEGYYHIPHPKDCRYYYFCIGGVAKLEQCPLNRYWHHSLEMCVRFDEVVCFGDN